MTRATSPETIGDSTSYATLVPRATKRTIPSARMTCPGQDEGFPTAMATKPPFFPCVACSPDVQGHDDPAVDGPPRLGGVRGGLVPIAVSHHRQPGRCDA